MRTNKRNRVKNGATEHHAAAPFRMRREADRGHEADKEMEAAMEDVAADDDVPLPEEDVVETEVESAGEGAMDEVGGEQTPADEDGETQERQDDAVAAESPQPADMAALLAEAEERGYHRGRDENIRQLMQAPAMMSPPSDNHGGGSAENSAADDYELLRHRRPSIWDAQ